LNPPIGHEPSALTTRPWLLAKNLASLVLNLFPFNSFGLRNQLLKHCMVFHNFMTIEPNKINCLHSKVGLYGLTVINQNFVKKLNKLTQSLISAKKGHFAHLNSN
jgi:hypothetical protein